MGRSKPYTVAGRAFRSQADLEACVKRHLHRHPLDTPFEDEFLAAVVNELHPSVVGSGQQSTGRFQFLGHAEQVRRGMDTAARFRGGPLLMAWFEPLGAWRPATVYPWRRGDDPAQAVKRALRQKSATLIPSPTPSDRCARDGCTATGFALEYEHVAPTFAEIADECLILMTPAEIASLFGYSKFTPGRDELVNCIPDDHPSIVHLRWRHQGNRWEWLCALHHRHVTAPRQYGRPADVAASVARQQALPSTTA